jgi:hypothetical protein
MIPSKHHQDKVIESIQSNLSKTIDMILNHSFIAALENKEISRPVQLLDTQLNLT